MKTKAICSFFVLFAIVAGIGATTPAAFADHAEVIVEAAPDSGNPGCEETDECLIPSVVTVDAGTKIIFQNSDTLLHTFVSGTVESNVGMPDDKFDSGVVLAGEEYEVDTADYEPGEYPYYCGVHTWMVGSIIVQEAEAEETMMDEEAHEEEMMDDEMMKEEMMDDEMMKEEMMDDEMMKEEMMDDEMMKEEMMDDEMMKEEMMDDETMMDEELMVTITDSVVDGETQVNLEFNTMHVNYEIIAMQNGEQISKETAHAMEMTGASHMIDAVGSDESPLDIEIVSLGIGPPGADQDWTGPTGMVAEKQVVPEFGTIAMMILAVAIISIVAVTAKSRVVPRF